MRRGILFLLPVLALACAHRVPHGPSMTAIDGMPLWPLDAGGGSAVVLFYVRTDCPISNGYAPEIGRIVAEYAPRGVRFRLVYPDADTVPGDALAHAREYQLAAPAVIDRERRLVALGEAKVTPWAAVFGPDGSLRYSGRIDDLYLAFGKRRAEPTSHDLRRAIDAVLEGRSVLPDRTSAVGCTIN